MMPAGTAVAAGAGAQGDPFELLGKLKQLLDAGAITPEEFAAKKKDLLGRM
jgi:hypothetical protein